MKPSDLIQQHREQLLTISRQFAVDNVRIFGSVAKGLDNENSDLDILLDPVAHTTLFDLGGLKIEFEELLGIKVDVLTPRSLPEALRDQIFREAKPL